MVYPPKYGEYFPKKDFIKDKRFWEKNYSEIILNYQIISRWGRSFINNKNIFQ